jgi:polysaccharide biosynthesis protein PslH
VNVLFATAVLPSPGAASGGSRVMFGELQAIGARYDVRLLALGVRGADEEAVALLRSHGYPAIVVWSDGGRSSRLRAVEEWLSGRMPLGAVDPGGRVQARVRSAAAGRDVLHIAASKWAGAALLGAPGWTRLPSILTEHEAAPAGHARRDGAPAVARTIEHLDEVRWHHYLRTSYRSFDQVQVFTPADSEAVVALEPTLASRIVVNPFGIDMPAAIDAVRTDTVVFVGNFNHPPNMDAARWLATEIMPIVRRSCPSASLTLVGRDASSRLAGNGVNLLGYVPDLARIYGSAGVVVAPLRSGSGMRVKVLEAMAYGCPVVATSLASHGLGSRDEELPLVIAETPDAIADAIVRLLSDPDDGGRLGKLARTYVAKYFTWEAYADRLAAAYERAIDHYRGRAPR